MTVIPLDFEGEERFQFLRRELGVSTFGISVLRMRPGQRGRIHRHERQEEVYIVLDGEIEMTFPGDEVRLLGTGGIARVDARTVRRIRNVSQQPATYVCVGAEGGYVGRDGLLPEGDDGNPRPISG